MMTLNDGAESFLFLYTIIKEAVITLYHFQKRKMSQPRAFGHLFSLQTP